jgi:phosphatidylethanolamine-binding protein (PEBP) family uncharacterized protein
VAQRTGAERFLASFVKTASAGAILALAVAALLLSGCGGGSSDSASTDAAGSAVAQSGGSPDRSSASPQDKSKASSQGGSGAKAPPSGSSSGASDPSAQSGQKHGPRIAQPKGPPEQAPSSEEIANATVADMSLESPAIVSSGGEPGSLAATYTCEGKDSWPQLRWSGVPAGTAELIFYVMNVQPVEGRLFVDWAVAGLDPGLQEIKAGELPKGAVVGTNGFGKRDYEICPAAGSGEIYIFAVYALPRSLSPQKGFDAREMRRQILDVSGNVGLLAALYARG